MLIAGLLDESGSVHEREHGVDWHAGDIGHCRDSEYVATSTCEFDEVLIAVEAKRGGHVESFKLGGTYAERDALCLKESVVRLGFVDRRCRALYGPIERLRARGR